MNIRKNIKRVFVLSMSLTMLLIAFTSQAQSDRDRSEDREKIAQLKIAHITRAMDLTEIEAQKFWPIYNKYEKLLREGHKNRPNLKNIESLSDVEATQILNQMFKQSTAHHENKVKMHEEMSQVLSPKQMLSYYKAETRFRKNMVDRLKGPRSEGRHTEDSK